MFGHLIGTDSKVYSVTYTGEQVFLVKLPFQDVSLPTVNHITFYVEKYEIDNFSNLTGSSF